MSPDRLERLTGVLHPLVSRLESIIPGPAYNLLLRTAPWVAGCDAWSHWRIELLPRVNALAGLELATGIHINHLPPERAAGQLRQH
jgi:UDPglucose--hexose-1-phosphate uridylyltransferase